MSYSYVGGVTKSKNFNRSVVWDRIKVSQGKGRKPPEGTKTEEGDSIGVVHRHETSPVDELGRCHLDRWMFCKGLLSCNSAQRYVVFRLRASVGSKHSKWRKTNTRATK